MSFQNDAQLFALREFSPIVPRHIYRFKSPAILPEFVGQNRALDSNKKL